MTLPYGDGGGALRLFDASIGVAVALIFSQVLFSPQPLRLIRTAETAALQQMARGLDQTVDPFRGEADAAAQALQTLRDVRRELDDVGFVQTAGVNVARRSVLWRHQRTLAVQASESPPNCNIWVRTVCSSPAPVCRCLLGGGPH